MAFVLTRSPSCVTAAALAATVIGALAASPASAAPVPAGSTVIVGAAASGTFTALPHPASSSTARHGSVSQNGRYVAFVSGSDGLSGADRDDVLNVFRKDRATGELELMSRRTGLGAANDADCRDASISDDGMRVAFACMGPLDPSDTNGAVDVYVRDHGTGETTLVSRAAAVGNGHSDDPEISGNGQFVAFASVATNLAAGSPATGRHVLRRALSGANAVVAVDVPNGGAATDGEASQPTISNDGQRVAFVSTATNLVPTGDDANGKDDVYLRDLGSGSTRLVSGRHGFGTLAANGTAVDPAISGNGLFVAFTATATDIGNGDTDAATDVHRRTLDTSAIVLVARVSGAGGAKADGEQYRPSIDDTGDAIAFVSSADNLGEYAGQVRHAFLRRIGTSTTTLVSRRSGSAGVLTSTNVEGTAISGDSGIVTVEAFRLADDADPYVRAVYARDLTTPALVTSLTSRPAGSEPFVNLGGAAHVSTGAMSADGRYTVFTSSAAGLPGQVVGKLVGQVYRRDAVTGEVVLVSRADGADGPMGTGLSSDPTISADGTRVAFTTTAKNLGKKGAGSYVRDIASGTTTHASLADGAGGAAVGNVSATAISGDGRRVAFVAPGTDPVAGNSHVFVRDLAVGTTAAVAPAHSGAAVLPRLDADGERVVWQVNTKVPNNPGFTSRAWHAAVDGSAGPARLDDGAPQENGSFGPTVSGDGDKVAFTSDWPLVGSDTNGTTDVYVRTLSSGAVALASLGSGGLSDGASTRSQISADGSRVAFSSAATDLTPGDTDGYDDVFVRDLAGATTTLVSRPGGPEGTISGTINGLAVDADGSCVVYQTPDTSLAADLTASMDRVWLRAVTGSCPDVDPAVEAKAGPDPAAPSAAAAPAPAAGAPPLTATKRAAAGRPVVGRVTATPARFATRGRRPGTTLRFTVDQTAKLRVVVARVVKGHRVGKRCRTNAPSRRRAKPCTLLRTVTTLSRAGKQGLNGIAFNGRIGRRPLAKGRYVATVVATSATGSSLPRTVNLRIR